MMSVLYVIVESVDVLNLFSIEKLLLEIEFVVTRPIKIILIK